MKKIKLISGLPPSLGGVGRLLNSLIDSADDAVEVIYMAQGGPVKALIANRSFLKAFIVLFKRVESRLIFFLKLFFMKGEECLCIHPQTIGFPLLLRMIKRNNVYLYVMDNSFFCISSYNYNPKEKKECLNCLNFHQAPMGQCIPYPVNYKLSKNLCYLKKLYKQKNKVTFLAQNINQEKLLRQHFGQGIESIVVGMNTNELEAIFPNRRSIHCYDFVYHGYYSLSKGLEYFVNIAENMPKYQFFIPLRKTCCEEVLGRTINGEHITFMECTWDTGLKEAVLNSKFTLNPSLWSAPIEGALIKSIYYGKNVFTVRSEYGFENELLKELNIGELPEQYLDTIPILENAILSYKYDEDVLIERRDKLLKLLENKDIFSVIRNEL